MPRGVNLGSRSRVDPAGVGRVNRKPQTEVPRRPSPHNYPGRIKRRGRSMSRY
jgi:hypothetical protein